MPRIQCPSVEEIVAVMRGKKYKVFKNPNGHDINLVGIRNSSSRANRFDDWISAFYWYDGIWNQFAFPGTTDPGTFYRENPLNVRGTAIMKPGQYRRAYKVGRHKGYKAMQQVGPITVYRDDNKDAELNTTGTEEDKGCMPSTFTGLVASVLRLKSTNGAPVARSCRTQTILTSL